MQGVSVMTWSVGVSKMTSSVDGVFQGLVERDDQIRELREEMLNMQRTLEEQISEERAALQDTQVSVCVCVCVCPCMCVCV